METTNFYKGFHTVVPAKIINELDLDENEIIDWESDKESRTITLSFRKKESLKDLAGIISLDEETNAVELKHKIQRGKK